jgi:DNA-binding transcriptional LysR family regulator
MQGRGGVPGLREFVAVVDHGSFTAAATRLRLGKSVVSERVRALEDQFGVRLFDRTTRRVRPTEAGAVLLEHARRILAAIDLAEGALQDLAAEPRGRLTVATTVNGAVQFLVPALADFRALHPGIEVHIIADDAVVEPADAGADVSIRFGAPGRSDWIARRIGPVDFLLAAAPAYLAARGTPATPADLAYHVCLPYRDQTVWRLGRDGTTVEHAPAAAVTTASGPVYRALILEGHGIGAVNRLVLARELASGAAVAVLPDWRLEGYGDVAAWIVLPDNRAIPPKVRVFADFVAQRMRTLTAR